MRTSISTLMAAATVMGCGASAAPRTQNAAPHVAVSCVPIYWFEFQVSDAHGQLTQNGATKLDARGCERTAVENELPEGQRHRFGVDPSRPEQAKFEVELAGEQIETHAPVVPNLRVVLEGRPRQHRAGTILVTVTPFRSEAAFKQAMVDRFARAGVDLNNAPSGLETFGPATSSADAASAADGAAAQGATLRPAAGPGE